MIYRSADPFRDLIDKEEDDAAYEALCPTCDICGEKITDEYFYQVCGITFHLDCADCKSVESYVEDKRYGLTD